MFRVINDEELMEIDPEIEAMEAQEQAYEEYYRKHKSRRTLSPMEMDQMTEEEIDEWYKYHGIYKE